MSGPEWGFIELDDTAPFKFALPEFKWSSDSAYFAFIYIHDEHVTTRQGVEGLSSKIRIVRLSDGQVRHVTGSRNLGRVKLIEFDDCHLIFKIAEKNQTVVLKQLNWSTC